jgi:hypothetical protein
VIERATGFITTPPFWVGSALNDLNPANRRRWKELSSSVAFERVHERFELQVFRDGLIALRIPSLELLEPEPQMTESAHATSFQKLTQWWAQYLDYVNTFHLILHSAVLAQKGGYAPIGFYEITPRDVIRIRSNEEYKIPFWPRYRNSVHDLMERRLRAPAIGTGPLLPNPALDIAVFDRCVDDFSTVVAEPRLVSVMSSVARALAQYHAGNFGTSVVLSWFVVESELNRLWESYLDSIQREYQDGSRRVNKDRRKGFVEGRDWTASVKSNVLELAEVLTFEQFRRVDRVRGYRNDVVHESYTVRCGPDRAKDAIELALGIALAPAGLSLRVEYEFAQLEP